MGRDVRWETIGKFCIRCFKTRGKNVELKDRQVIYASFVFSKSVPIAANLLDHSV